MLSRSVVAAGSPRIESLPTRAWRLGCRREFGGGVRVLSSRISPPTCLCTYVSCLDLDYRSTRYPEEARGKDVKEAFKMGKCSHSSAARKKMT